MKGYLPETVAIEELFFNTNVTTGITVGQARGVAILAAYKAGIEVTEYTPLQVKQAITSYGRADKRQVQEMVKALLNLREIPKPTTPPTDSPSQSATPLLLGCVAEPVNKAPVIQSHSRIGETTSRTTSLKQRL